MTAPLGKIIESIRLAKGLSQSDLARALQVSPQAVQKWEAGGMPRPSRLADIAAALGVSVTFLLDQESQVFGYPDYASRAMASFQYADPLPLSDETKQALRDQHKATSWAHIPVTLSEHPDLVDVPRVKFKLSAGVTGFAVEQDQGSGPPIFFRRDFFEDNGYRPDALLAVRVTGSSMEPSLWEGDLVVINTNDVSPSDGEPFALNYEGELVIKRLKRDAGEWWATSDNPDQRRFAPKRCTEDVKIIGKAVYKQSPRI